MTLTHSQSSSGNTNSDVLVHRSSNSRNCGSGGGLRRNNCDRGQISKNCSFQYHKPTGDSERKPRTLSSTMPIASACSYNSEMASFDQGSKVDSDAKSKDAYLDERLYKNAPETVDPSIVSRGSASLSRRYTRSALYLLRNDTRSRCRPKCASKLQLLCIWKTNNINHQNGGNSNNSSNSLNAAEMGSSSLSSPRMSSITRQQSNHDLQSSVSGGISSSHNSNQKSYLDHRSISSSHLMPAFAKRRIGNSMQSNAGNSSAGSQSLSISTESMKAHISSKNNNQKQFLSPQRRHLTTNQLSKSVQLMNTNSLDVDRELDQEHDGGRDRERGRDHDSDMNLNASGSSSSNARERRIGSGRLLPRDVNWDYRSEKDSNLSSASSVSMAFDKDVSSHSAATGNNTQRLPSNSGGNLNSSHHRLDFARSPTSKDRIGGGKNSSEYRSEPRYESRRSFARGEYERDNRTDNSNYVRRFMSDLINQNSGNNFSGKSSSAGQNHNEHRRRNHRNDEPEWFSSGPTSQHDTIELRGFDEIEDSNSNSSGSGGGNGKHNKKSKQTTKKNRPNNLQTHSLGDSSPVDNMSKTGETGNGNERDNSGACNEDTRTTSITPSSPNAHSPPSPKASAKSDTNNNSRKPKNCGQIESKPFSEGDKSIFKAASKNKTDDIDINTQNNANKKRTNISPIAKVNPSQAPEKTGFNFDAFLNADPMSNLLMGEQNSGENTAGSRFSRWFVKQGDGLIINSDSRKSSLTEEMVSMMNESQIMSQNDGEAPVVAESTNTNQSNTLMEFLQRGRINPPSGTSEVKASVGSIPSVEELEARMRKIGEQNITLSREQPVPNMYDNMNNPLNQLLSNSVHHHHHHHQHQQQQQQQQQQKHTQHFVMKNEIQAAPILNSTGETQQHIHINNPHQLAPPQTQDMEAFKKLLEQITPTALSTVKVPTQSNIQQLAPPQQTQMHRLPPPVNMLTAIGAIAQPTPMHLIKNDELTKFIQQQQQHQRRQQHVMTGPHQTQLNQGPPNEVQAMFLAPQQRSDAQLLLQGMSRGEVTPSSLGHTIGNPSSSPRAKEALTSVLRETSRDTSPNVIMSVPQIMSPVLGQSHSATNIPVPPPPNIMPNPQQILFNHQPQAGSQQPHPSSGANAGGLQQRIPSPRELQYHTQSIMQNALIKKKLEEQQENFRRRQEIQKLQMQLKPVQPHLEVNEFGVLIGSPQQQHPQNQLHQKKISQQQQIIQGQQQQRHVNSPTPLAFTPTSVLRKMTAEKESGNSFHASASPASSSSAGTGTVNTSPLISTMATANVGANNSNSNKPIHSLLMHYQHQQTNSSQNQPRMILGVGSNSQQQQQQQQGVAIISGPPMQQQHHPDNSRLNTTLRNNQIKWSGTIMNQISITKPMGRPILKGSLTQSVAPPTNSGLNLINQQQSQTVAQPSQMAFASKIEFQQIQQQRSAGNNQPPHPQKQQQQQQSISPQQQSQNILMTQLYQQRAAVQRAQQYQIHHIHQQQQINIIQNNGNRPDRTGSNGNTSQSSSGNIIHYQRDGGLSPTSNQLARWFSPELLAQASAGKLPPLNINQALSLEEFEKSIQHSSTAVNN